MRKLREAFISILLELARQDEDIILITDDTGYSLFEKFQKELPNQFINAGICEQFIIGFSAGLAKMGKKPYVYGIIPFAIMRCYEQLRDDVCYHNANVTIIGVGGYQYYKFLGFTHNIEEDEDIKILGHLPNLKIYTPKTPEEVLKIVQETYQKEGPAYVRL